MPERAPKIPNPVITTRRSYRQLRLQAVHYADTPRRSLDTKQSAPLAGLNLQAVFCPSPNNQVSPSISRTKFRKAPGTNIQAPEKSQASIFNLPSERGLRSRGSAVRATGISRSG